MNNSPFTPIDIPQNTLKRWQSIINICAELIGVPAALIMRLLESDIEVFVSSQSKGNPYQPGDHEHFLGSGLYCETVVNTRNKLLVPNALVDEKWKNNPDIKLNMVSYLGFPIIQPDGKVFGTICVLDNHENSYSDTYETLITSFRDIIQGHIELIYMNNYLGNENKNLSDYISEIKTLRGILPICNFCKKIRNDEGYWKAVEDFISHHTEADFSHSICPECMAKHYPEYSDKEPKTL